MGILGALPTRALHRPVFIGTYMDLLPFSIAPKIAESKPTLAEINLHQWVADALILTPQMKAYSADLRMLQALFALARAAQQQPHPLPLLKTAIRRIEAISSAARIPALDPNCSALPYGDRDFESGI